MEYRICYYEKCEKESEYGLNVKSQCECGGDNWKALKFITNDYSGVRLDTKIKDIFKE